MTILLTALAFLLVGYCFGRMQNDPELARRSYKELRQRVSPGRVGAVKRPTAEALARREHPERAQEEDAMKELLDEIL